MKTYSSDLRQKIVETKIETQETDQKIAERFRVSRSFVNKLVRQYHEIGDYRPRPHGGGAQTKLAKEQELVIIQLVAEDNDATLQQLCERVEQKTQLKVSISTMCRVLQKLKLTRKKKSLHATEAESERVQNLRREYWMTIREVNLKDLVFIDETGINLAMTPSYGRAKKGKRAYNKCPFNRGNNVSLIGAISFQAILASLTFEGWTNKEAFLTYVTEVLVPQLWTGACVVMDNLPAHKASIGSFKLLKQLELELNFCLLILLTLIKRENCWSKLKQYLRSCESRTYTELDQAITEAINLVTNQDLVGWFTHCCYYVPSN